jgi:ribulose-phosphate 3-epimerase
MINTPEAYVGAFAEAGSDLITIQVEATIHTLRVLAQIREHGVMCGVALCPGTPLSAIEELLPFVDQVLVMSVNPGFGGQTFIPSALNKIARLRTLIDEKGIKCRIQVDGGIKASNIGRVAEAGADSFVVGSSVFDGTANIGVNIEALRSALVV